MFARTKVTEVPETKSAEPAAAEPTGLRTAAVTRDGERVLLNLHTPPAWVGAVYADAAVEARKARLDFEADLAQLPEAREAARLEALASAHRADVASLATDCDAVQAELERQAVSGAKLDYRHLDEISTNLKRSRHALHAVEIAARAAQERLAAARKALAERHRQQAFDALTERRTAAHARMAEAVNDLLAGLFVAEKATSVSREYLDPIIRN